MNPQTDDNPSNSTSIPVNDASQTSQNVTVDSNLQSFQNLVNDEHVDDKFLAAMGLEGLQGEEKDEALEDILYTLNMNIGNRVVDMLSDEQAEEFELLSRPSSDPQKLHEWLFKAIPNYAQIIEEETQKLRDETIGLVDEVMGSKEQK
jgi:hypothetical protein